MIWETPCTLQLFQQTLQTMTQDLLADFENLATNELEKLTWGERLFVQHGLTGIRGEAQQGYPLSLNRECLIIKNIKAHNNKTH